MNEDGKDVGSKRGEKGQRKEGRKRPGLKEGRMSELILNRSALNKRVNNLYDNASD